jgi:hypothetical protein
MGLDPFLPQHVVELMTAEGRAAYAKAIGCPAAGKTLEELAGDAETEAEKKLQKEIGQYLQLRELAYINPSMNRKSPLPPGWPDFTFCYRGFGVLWETKRAKAKFEESQKKLIPKLIKNGWRFGRIESLTAARDFLRELDNEADRTNKQTRD